MVCPRPESCDALRALMSVTPNLCCDETEPRSIRSHDIANHKSLKLELAPQQAFSGSLFPCPSVYTHALSAPQPFTHLQSPKFRETFTVNVRGRQETELRGLSEKASLFFTCSQFRKMNFIGCSYGSLSVSLLYWVEIMAGTIKRTQRGGEGGGRGDRDGVHM